MWVMHRCCCARKVNNLAVWNFFVDRCFFVLIFSTSRIRYEITIKSLSLLINTVLLAIIFDVDKFFMQLDHSMVLDVSKFRSLISAD